MELGGRNVLPCCGGTNSRWWDPINRLWKARTRSELLCFWLCLNLTMATRNIKLMIPRKSKELWNWDFWRRRILPPFSSYELSSDPVHDISPGEAELMSETVLRCILEFYMTPRNRRRISREMWPTIKSVVLSDQCYEVTCQQHMRQRKHQTARKMIWDLHGKKSSRKYSRCLHP